MSVIKVITNFSNDIIESRIEGVGIEQFGFGQISRQIVQLQEEGVRKALIELGWTPPKDK